MQGKRIGALTMRVKFEVEQRDDGKFALWHDGDCYAAADSFAALQQEALVAVKFLDGSAFEAVKDRQLEVEILQQRIAAGKGEG